MKTEELSVPAYLNQSIVFDLLAIIEDGFSTVKTIKSSSSSLSKNEVEVEAKVDSGLGVKNVFSLLSIGIRGKYAHIGEKEKGNEENFEKVHTPTSLFWKLRDYLIKNELISNIEIIDDKIQLQSSNFIEFEGVLRKNPIIESIDNIKELMDLIYVFSPETVSAEQKNNPGGGKSAKHGQQKKPQILEQVEAFSKALKINDTIDFLSVEEQTNIKIVITCDQSFFINNNANRVVDGRYRILGKVVHCINDTSESISLLRTTSLNRFNKNILDQMFAGFSGAESSGIDLPEIITEISGPCVQIVPICIFI
jgi:hypothetical protein